MRSRSYRHLAAATFAVAALASAGEAAAADGVMRPDDRPTHGPGAVAAQSDVVVRPDDRADRRLPGATVAIVRPATTGGFDWADAGIGAMATLGVVVVVGGGAIAGLRRRPRLA